MKAIVIYDATGRIWNIIYGEETLPPGVPCMFVDIPDGAQIERIDVSDPGHLQPVFITLPESDIGRLQKAVEALKAQLDTIDGAIADLGEATSALAESMAGEAEQEDIGQAGAETEQGGEG